MSGPAFSMQQNPERTGDVLAGLGVLAAALWIGSLFADVGVYPLTDDVPHEDSGWVLLEYGWIGPFVLSIAWYGNILFLICIVTLLRGRVPRFALATASLGIAASSLLPIVGLDERLGVPLSLVRGPAVWLWLMSFLIAWLPAAYSQWVARAGESHKKL
jgi:hypothetical protein